MFLFCVYSTIVSLFVLVFLSSVLLFVILFFLWFLKFYQMFWGFCFVFGVDSSLLLLNYSLLLRWWLTAGYIVKTIWWTLYLRGSSENRCAEFGVWQLVIFSLVLLVDNVWLQFLWTSPFELAVENGIFVIRYFFLFTLSIACCFIDIFSPFDLVVENGIFVIRFFFIYFVGCLLFPWHLFSFVSDVYSFNDVS